MAALGDPDDARARRRHDRRAGRARRSLPGAVLTRVAASHIRVGTFQFFAARGDAGAARPSPPTPSRGTTPTPWARATTRSRCSSGWSTRRRARRALARRRLRARRDEHRQHVDLRRDPRLRPVRVPRRVRSGQDVQLDRPRRPLRVREPAAHRAVEPDAARRGAPASSATTRTRRCASRPRSRGLRALRGGPRAGDAGQARARRPGGGRAGSALARACSSAWPRTRSTTRSSSAASARPPRSRRRTWSPPRIAALSRCSRSPSFQRGW